METFRAIMRGDLPPVGSPIKLGPRQTCTLKLPGFYATWVDSGTSALALALLAAKASRPEITYPEVIIPGYCCPDLVSACVYAGCIAKLVDVRNDGWGFDLDQFQQALSDRTLAVIGVNFLGIREDWQAINSILKEHNPAIVTIEDSAQWFPNLADSESFVSDYIVFSFGKGKPLSLLSGGALFSRNPLNEISKAIAQSKPSIYWTLKGKYFLFNKILNPSLYWFLNHNPIYKPGKTQYKTLNTIQELDGTKLDLIQTNYNSYSKYPNSQWNVYDEQLLQLGIYNGIWPADKTRVKRLLRYPLLCSNRIERDKLLSTLNERGLGATAMYQKALSDLNCPTAFIDTSLPHTNAQKLAEHLITLPCHPGVTPQHYLQINNLLTASAKAGGLNKFSL